MSFKRGPKIISDGLIFGYNADDRTSRFYPGEPTVNLVTDSYYSYRDYNVIYSCNSWGGDDATVMYYSNGGFNDLPYKKMNKTSPGDGGSFIDDNYGFEIVSGKTYTLSCYMKASQSIYLNAYSYSINRAVDNYYKNGDAISLSTEWERIIWTFTAGNDESGIYLLRGIIYEDNDLPLDIYWCGYQIEENSHATQFTKSYRENTNSLIDLKRKTTIDLSNISFDPSAHPVFDGTNDYIRIQNLTSLSNNYTVSAWIKILGYSSDTNVGQVIMQQYGSNIGWIFSLVGPTALLEIRNHHNGTSMSYNLVYNKSLEINTWYQVIASDNDSIVNLYVNGIVVATTSSSLATPNNGESYIGSFFGSNFNFNGYIKNLNLYNRALSQDEISENYNSNKNRFNI